MATNVELRFDPVARAWLYWDDVRNQFANPQPTEGAADNLVIYNGDVRFLQSYDAGAGSDTYHLQADFATEIHIDDTQRDVAANTYNVLRIDADVNLASLRYRNGNLEINLSSFNRVTVNSGSLDAFRFEVAGNGLLTSTEFYNTYASGGTFEGSNAVFDALTGDYTISDTDGSGTNVGAPVTATDADGDTITYSLSAESLALGYSINAQTGQISYTSSDPLVTHEVHTLTVIASSFGAGQTTRTVTQEVMVTVLSGYPASDPVFDNSINGPFSLVHTDDGTVTPIAIGRVTADDINNDPIQYSLSASSMNNGFRIDADTGDITYVNGSEYFNIEIISQISVSVQATSLGASGQQVTVTELIYISLQYPPADAVFDPISGDYSIYFEDDGRTTPVNIGAPITASDINNDPITYTLDSADLAAGFAIDSTTGQLSFTGPPESFNQEPDTTYSITVIATSIGATGSTAAVQTTVPVLLLRQMADAVFDPLVGDYSLFFEADGQTTPVNIGNPITATDINGDAVSYSLDVTSANAGFNIDATTGQLSYTGAPDSFTQDPGTSFSVTVLATSIGATGQSVSVPLIVPVVLLHEPADPIFDVVSGDYILFFEADGQTSAVTIGTPITASDLNEDAIEYAIDAASAALGFDIDAATGQLLYTGAPNSFTQDPGTSLTITVSATALGASGQPVTIQTSVSVVLEHAPADAVFDPIIGDYILFFEADGQTTPVNIGAPITATDINGDPVSYTLDSASINAGLTINSATGQLSYVGPPNSFTQNPNPELQVTVLAISTGASGTISVVQTTFFVQLEHAPADAVFDPLVGDYSLFFEADGQTTPVTIGAPVTATDINGDAVSYSLDAASVNAGFNIDATTGQLSYTGAPDSFTQDPGTSFSVTVIASSIGASGQPVSVQTSVPVVLEHAPADPIFDTVSGDHILFFEADGQTSAVTIGTPITASDLNEDAIEYAIDAASAALGFDIDAATGQLLYTGAPNSFTQDPGTSLTITVSATALGASGQPVTIQTSVAVVLEHAPANAVFDPLVGDYTLFLGADGQVTPVNIGAPITASDINGDPISYSVSNTSAVNGFAIDAVTGQLSYIGAPESFSQPAGSSYSVTVIARSIGVSGQETNVVRTVNVVLSNETPGTSGSDIVNQGSTAGDFIIETGDGNDEITVGRGDNDIDAGPGDDIIDISSGGRDRLAMRVSFDGAALDGDDVVAGFEAHGDIVYFVKDAGDTYNGPGTEPATTAEWLARMTGDDGVPLNDDDLMMVSPIITFADDGTPIVSGLRFQFREGSLHNGGASISLGSIEVNFATPLTIDEFLAAIGGAENYDIDLMAIIDLTTGLRGLLGRDGIRYGADVVVKTSLSHADVVAALANDEDLWNWDVSALVSGDSLFYDPTGTNQDILDFNQDIGNWDVGNMLFTFSMFRGAASFNQDIGDWDVGRVTNFQSMFQDATSFNQDISGWDISSATTLADMFSGASAFNQNLGSWDISSLATAAGIFDDPDGNSVLSTANLDATLRGWARLDTAAGETAIQNNVVFGASGQSYTAATTIAYLEATYSWTFEAGMVFDISAAWQGTSAGDAYNANVASTVRSFHGLGGNDIITGTTNDEHFYGGAGNDTLIGGGGSDTFHYLHTNSGSDTIIGFDSANDKIDLSLLLVGYDPATSNLADFVQGQPHDFNGTSTVLIIDHDGGNSPDFSIVLQGVAYTGLNQIDDFLAADVLVLV